MLLQKIGRAMGIRDVFTAETMSIPNGLKLRIEFCRGWPQGTEPGHGGGSIDEKQCAGLNRQLGKWDMRRKDVVHGSNFDKNHIKGQRWKKPKSSAATFDRELPPFTIITAGSSSVNYSNYSR